MTLHAISQKIDKRKVAIVALLAAIILVMPYFVRFASALGYKMTINNWVVDITPANLIRTLSTTTDTINAITSASTDIDISVPDVVKLGPDSGTAQLTTYADFANATWTKTNLTLSGVGTGGAAHMSYSGASDPAPKLLGVRPGGSSGNTFGSRSSVAFSSSGDPYIAWATGSQNSIAVAYIGGTGPTSSTPCASLYDATEFPAPWVCELAVQNTVSTVRNVRILASRVASGANTLYLIYTDNGGLFYRTKSTEGGAWSGASSIYNNGVEDDSVEAAVDAEGNVFISYITGTSIRVAVKPVGSSTIGDFYIGPANTASGTAIVASGSGGSRTVRIAYQGAGSSGISGGDNKIIYGECSVTITGTPACSGGNWNRVPVEAESGTVRGNVNLVLDAAGNPVVGFMKTGTNDAYVVGRTNSIWGAVRDFNSSFKGGVTALVKSGTTLYMYGYNNSVQPQRCVVNLSGTGTCTPIAGSTAESLPQEINAAASPVSGSTNIIASYSYNVAGNGLYIDMTQSRQTSATLSGSFSKQSNLLTNIKVTGSSIASATASLSASGGTTCNIAINAGSGTCNAAFFSSTSANTVYFTITLANSSSKVYETGIVESLEYTYIGYKTSGTVYTPFYNTNDATSLFTKISWTGTPGALSSDLKVYMRTGPSAPTSPATQYNSDTPPSGWTAWCGADCSGVGVTSSDFANNFSTLHSSIQDGVNDQYFQLKLVFSSTGTATPIVDDLVIDYVRNTKPTISGLSGTIKKTTAGASTPSDVNTITLSYTSGDADADNNTLDTYVFYDLGVTVTQALDNASSSSFTLSDDTKIPSGSLMLIDDEFIYKSGATYTRAVNRTRLASHSIGAKVWIMASKTALSGNIGTVTSGSKPSDANYRVYVGSGPVTKGSGKTITWDLKAEPNLSNQQRTLDVRVVVNDRELANAVNTLVSTPLTIDTTNPVGGSIGMPSYNSTANFKTGTATQMLAIGGFSDTGSGLEMSVSATAGVFTTWETYTTTKAVTLNCSGIGENTFYIRVRDTSGNTTDATSNVIRCDTTPPNVPSGLVIQSVCDINANTTRPFLSWQPITDPGDFAGYRVMRGVTLVTTITDIGTANQLPSYTDTGLTSGTASYTITAIDNVSPTSPNVSAPSNAVSFTVQGDCNSDTTKPAITDAAIANVTKTTATASWATNEAANSTVGLSIGDTTYDDIVSTNASYVTTRSIALVGLSCGTTYNAQLSSTDSAGNTQTRTTKNDDTALTFSTSACESAPTISGETSTAGSRSTTITWSTNIPASAEIIINGLTFGSASFDATPLTHSVSTNDILSPSSSYTATIRSKNSDGVEATKSVQVNTTADPVTLPLINSTSIPVSALSCGSATVTWTTDIPATSYVQYGLYGSASQFGQTAGSEVLTTTHTVTLTGLSPQENYAYRVLSGNAAGDRISPADGSALSFTSAACTDTSAPVISNVTTTSITESSAVVTWSTDDSANAIVQYSAGDKSYELTAGSLTLFAPVVSGSANHAVTLSGLSPATTYYFRVRSTNNVGLVTTNDNSTNGFTFTTQAGTAPPQVLTVTHSNVTEAGATITWTTDTAGDSFVDLGTSIGSYGLQSQGDATVSSTNHSVVLTGLNAGTTYYYQVRTTNASGATGVSYAGNATLQATLTFTTTSIVDAVAPTISGVTAVSITSSSVVIQFNTNEDALGEAVTGQTIDYGGESNFGSSYAKIHTLLIEGLEPNTKYYYKVTATDEADNQSNSSGHSFTTAVASAGDTQNPNQDNPLTCDTSAPSITSSYPDGTETKSVLVANLGARAATIMWETNEQSSSIVEYGEDPNKLEFLGGDVTAFSYDHAVDIKPLKYETTYFYQVVLLDGCGNQSRSDVYQLTTLTPGPGELETELEAEIQTEATAAQLKLLESLGSLSSSTQSIIKGFLDALGGIDSAERDKAVEIVVGQVIGPPRILGAKPNVTITDDSAIIEWETLSETTGIVRYASDATFSPEKKDNPYSKSAGDSEEYVTAHRVALLELRPFTTYHYQILGSEKNGRKAISIDRTFKTSPLQPKFDSIKLLSASEQGVTIQWKTNLPTTGILSLRNLKTGEGKTQEDDILSTSHEQSILGLAERTDYRAIVSARSENGVQVDSDPIRFTTRPDNEPPVIDQVRTKLTLSPGKSDTVQAVISWHTNEPSLGTILYDEGVQGDSLRLKSDTESDMTLTHVLVLSKLRPGTIYTFKVQAKDLAGNEGLSREYKMYTPRKSESVLELIIKNFEDAFGFLK